MTSPDSSTCNPLSRTVINCFKCNKQLDSVWRSLDRDEAPVQPHDGVTFLAGGNYGSRIWDPCTSSLNLRIIICDDCLRENASNVLVVRRIAVADKYEHFLFEPGQNYR